MVRPEHEGAFDQRGPSSVPDRLWGPENAERAFDSAVR
jgi:hypothetical protein